MMTQRGSNQPDIKVSPVNAMEAKFSMGQRKRESEPIIITFNGRKMSRSSEKETGDGFTPSTENLAYDFSNE